MVLILGVGVTKIPLVVELRSSMPTDTCFCHVSRAACVMRISSRDGIIQGKARYPYAHTCKSDHMACWACILRGNRVSLSKAKDLYMTYLEEKAKLQCNLASTRTIYLCSIYRLYRDNGKENRNYYIIGLRGCLVSAVYR